MKTPPGTAPPLFALVEQIYAAAEDSALWPSVLEGISHVLHGESIAFFAHFGDAGVPAVLALEQMDADEWAKYATYYASINPIMQRCEELLPVGSTWFADHVITNDDLRKTEFYNDFFLPNRMHHSVGIRFQLSDSASVNLSCQRPEAMGEFNEYADRVIQFLRPHIHRSLSFHQRLETMGAKLIGLQEAVDAFHHAVIGIDHAGKVKYVSRAAEALLERGDTLKVQQGVLKPVRPESAQFFQSQVQAVLGTAENFVPSSKIAFLLPRKGGAAPLSVALHPLLANCQGYGSGLAALVFLGTLEAAVSRGSIAGSLYRLSPVEQRVADLLCDGTEMRALARTMGLGLEATRFHVKQLFKKTGTRRQVDLVRLLLSLPGF